jgi:hypothetical protein
MALGSSLREGNPLSPVDFAFNSGIAVLFVVAAIFIFKKKDISYTAD